MSDHDNAPHPPSLRSQLGTLAALIVLLALTAGSALVPLGSFNTIVNIAISIAKTLLVVTFFMRLRSDAPLLRIAAAVGYIWLAAMICLTLADYLTRSLILPPW